MIRSHTPTQQRQRGVAAVEFALVSIFFLTLVLGIIELGRLMYVWNTVQEVTRHAAREAVVRDFTTDVDAITREAVFGGGTTGLAYMPGSPEVTNSTVRLTYLDINQNPVNPAPADPADNMSACGDITRTTSCIRYVRAEVCDTTNCGGVFYQPLIGFLLGMSGIDWAIRIPISPVVMPAESLGFVASS
ncbi:hypothetical protein OTERR_00820 [Oryzomicrobium terrae]|uniref:TadE-like domain-containing protein n=1 Tax=Oryzomicrobium terrae TaxID=1735038 RepID=A0A5C1E5L2_9RHOO|nr:TadE/TadG family type IV pilus assembly protein [Oryzomicrobium terrae]QEL63558.1 hypothetical protein OTERR_00820 [Oryzomicrobium terrae]